MFLYRDISEYLFCNPVGVVYHHLNIDGSETSYNQSEMICNQVADGLYVMQGSISLFNPNSKGVFLLVVMKRDSVSFKNENVNWSYIGKSVTDRSLDLLQKMIDFEKKYKINVHMQKNGTMYFTCNILEVMSEGVIKFKKEGLDSDLFLNMYDCHFLRFRVC
jgi:hypothetical protein